MRKSDERRPPSVARVSRGCEARQFQPRGRGGGRVAKRRQLFSATTGKRARPAPFGPHHSSGQIDGRWRDARRKWHAAIGRVGYGVARPEGHWRASPWQGSPCLRPIGGPWIDARLRRLLQKEVAGDIVLH